MSVDASPSPPPSLTIRSPPSSRTSLDLPAATNSPLSRPANSRRNRAALRDYYGIKSSGDDASSTPDGAPEATPQQLATVLGDLDRDGFDAATYVKRLLETESLESVLKVEGALVSEIRGLDGERKALVYDNYSKLIAATDTIQKVRAPPELCLHAAPACSLCFRCALIWTPSPPPPPLWLPPFRTSLRRRLRSRVSSRRRLGGRNTRLTVVGWQERCERCGGCWMRLGGSSSCWLRRAEPKRRTNGRRFGRCWISGVASMERRMSRGSVNGFLATTRRGTRRELLDYGF